MPIHGYMNANGSRGKKTDTSSRSRMVHPSRPASIPVLDRPVSRHGVALGLDASRRGDQGLDAGQDLAPRVLLLDELARLPADAHSFGRSREQAHDAGGEGLGGVLDEPVGAVASVDALSRTGTRDDGNTHGHTFQ